MTNQFDPLERAVEHGQTLTAYQQEKHELLRLLKRLYHDGSIGLYDGGDYVIDEDGLRDLAEHFIRHDYEFLVFFEPMLAERVKRRFTLDSLVPLMLSKAERMAVASDEWQDLRQYVVGIEVERVDVKGDLGWALRDGDGEDR